MYLGSSDGTAPFIGGVVENNLLINPVGYCIQIKFQISYLNMPWLSELPPGSQRTIIRNNVFIKEKKDWPAGVSEGARPNLLVSPFPDSGPGRDDFYEIYGNFFYRNPDDAMFQGSGRFSLHDNIFVGADGDFAGMVLRDHDGPLSLAHIYNNTIFGCQSSIKFSSKPRAFAAVMSNLIFSRKSVEGLLETIQIEGNFFDLTSGAGDHVRRPSLVFGEMDFYPLESCQNCKGLPLDFSRFTGETDYQLDFNGDPKGDFSIRGAYAGTGNNPGWQLQNNFKQGGPAGMTEALKFRRGDANGDGELDISDPLAILLHLFLRAGLIQCLESADLNDDEAVEVSDPIFLLEYLFLNGAAPAEPFAACGAVQNPPALGCRIYRPCE